MHHRCYNPKNHKYADYGGRGIRVCDRWQGVNKIENFIADMGYRPEGLSIDRKDNDGNYEPSNCRWATKSQQVINQRHLRTPLSGYKGVTRNKQNWQAEISVDKILHLGTYKTPEEAAIAYDMAAMQFYDGICHLNFLGDK